MNLGIKSISVLLTLSLACLPVLAKKPAKLQFNKHQAQSEQDVTGHLLYLNDSENDVDLLIQNSSNLVYYPNIVQNTLASEAQNIEIPEQVLFYNVGKRAGVEQDVLFYLTKDQVLSYDFTTKETTALFNVDSFYRYQQEFEVKTSPFVLDANGDELSDIITYSLSETHLHLQQSDGSFTKQTFELAPNVFSSSDSVTFRLYKLFHVDINGDDRKDISYQVHDQLVSFIQKEDGSFTVKPKKTALNAGIISSIARKKLKKASNEQVAQVSIESIEDLNNDNVVDLITKERVKTGMISSDNELKIRFGKITDGVLTFNKDPDGKAVFEGEGDLVFKDINQDGYKDYYTRGVEIGFGMLMSAMSGSVDVDLNFYLMNSDGKYAKKPVFKSEMEVEFSDDSNGFGLNAIEDFNGDGVLDLILQTDDDEFKIHTGGGKKIFAKRGASYDIELPVKGRSEVKDFNGDGKADILLLHGKKYDDDEEKEIGKNQVVLWLSAG